jgi:hypothetical protein
LIFLIFLTGFLSAKPNTFLKLTQTDADKRIDEYKPAKRPKIIGYANSLIEEEPKIASNKIVTKVVTVVKIDLDNVFAIASLAISLSFF